MRGLNSRFYIFLFIFLILISLTVFLVVQTIYPIFYQLAKIEAVRYANRIINNSVDKEVAGLRYDELIYYKTNQAGNIVLMQPDIRKINLLSSRIAIHIQDELEKIKFVDIKLPMARLFGLDLFAGMGPWLNARVVPIGFLEPPKIEDSFSAAGINQTRHKLYLQVDVKMKMIVPFSSKTTIVSAEVPVIEVTILGRVPEIYVGINGEDAGGLIRQLNNKK